METPAPSRVLLEDVYSDNEDESMSMETSSTTEAPPPLGPLTPNATINAYLAAWQTCITELQHLEDAARATPLGPVRGLKRLEKQQRNGLERVVRKLRRIMTSALPAGEQTPVESEEVLAAQFAAGITCSWQARWEVLKKYRGLLQLNKEFPWSPRVPVGPGEDWLALRSNKWQEKPVLVDAVVDNGAKWVKFVETAHQALENKILRSGWDIVEEDGMDVDSERDGEAEDWGNLEFAWGIQDLITTARWNHCRQVHVILPRVEEGKSTAIDKVLNRIRETSGSDVSVAFTCANSPFFTDPPPPVETAFANLLDRNPLVDEERFGVATHVVNLDPSLLIGLVSDLSHGPVPRQPEVQRHIITLAQQDSLKSDEGTNAGTSLPDFLYPLLAGHKLVCTRWAATYFRKVIDAIATSSEAARAELILPPQSAKPGNPPTKLDYQLRAKLQQWSSFPVPTDLQLPIEIVDDIDLPQVEALVADRKLPPMALGVAADLSPLNRSVYLYGWAHRITTLTSHRGVARQVDLSVARHWTRESAYGPDVLPRRMCGFLVHREKPNNWREYMPGDGDPLTREVPPEMARWATEWTTWGRGINAYGVPDTKAWEGVGHPEQREFGRRGKKYEDLDRERWGD